MNFAKNLIIGIFVIALSSGIFILLLQDQSVKESIFRSTLEMFGDDLLKMVPPGEQRDLLGKKIDEFIAKAEKNELSEKQVQVTVARGFNMQLSPEKPTPEEIHALFDVPPERSRPSEFDKPPRDKGRRTANEINEERVAHQVRKLMSINQDMRSLIQTDSAYKELSKYTMFVADSGLQVVIDPNFYQQRVLPHNPQLDRLWEELSKEEQTVVFHKFSEMPNIVEQALDVSAPFLPRNLRKIVINADISADSLHIDFSKFMSNPDSVKKMIEESMRILDELKVYQP
ncbi:hypothetical protein EH223_15005 [candidate division KSB1 bacterium]|nr:hypothetical protein [candidate division KSB1 bacterium]RQW01472.1 MAG: hypothetical protein EH223_15005 [candidate division KSB1 bacterium]